MGFNSLRPKSRQILLMWLAHHRCLTSAGESSTAPRRRLRFLMHWVWIRRWCLGRRQSSVQTLITPVMLAVTCSTRHRPQVHPSCFTAVCLHHSHYSLLVEAGKTWLTNVGSTLGCLYVCTTKTTKINDGVMEGRLKNSKSQVKQDVAFVNLGLTYRSENAWHWLVQKFELRLCLKALNMLAASIFCFCTDLCRAWLEERQYAELRNRLADITERAPRWILGVQV